MENEKSPNNTITYCKGDIFSAAVEALVNPVNCVGIMGAGLAKQFKKKFPGNFDNYKVQCAKGLLKPGFVDVYRTGYRDFHNYIVNFPTKLDWKYASEMSFIHLGLYALAEAVEYYKLSSIAIPALGCGLGQLRWKLVKPIIVETMARLSDVRTIIYEPLEDEK